MTLFGYIMVMVLILAIITLLFSFIMLIEDGDMIVPLAIVGCICLVIFFVQTKIVLKDEVIFYGDEYNIANIKVELEAKGISGIDEQISITEREYIKTYYSRFDGCTHYEYATHPGDIQINDFEKYKK